jgi:hypothetical protein
MRFKEYDAVIVTSSGSIDTYTFYKGGTSGTIVGTDYLVWTDSTRNFLANVQMR